MTGVLLVNMGGARTEKEMKSFLSRMFKDPRILPFGRTFRNILSFIISSSRYKKSWKKYQLIGGTPIIDATRMTVQSLQTELDSDYNVKMAFSYSSPTIEDSLLYFKDEGINNIKVIPLYPQSSFSTSGSVLDDIQRVMNKEESLDIHFEKRFFQHDGFVDFWTNLITTHIQLHHLKHPFLLYSAHSIPEYLVRDGDTYPREIRESGTLISHKLGLDYEVAYQSGMSGGKWIGPDVNTCLKNLAKAGKKEIVIIPISFVNENLETLYDLDKVIVPFAKTIHGIVHVSRVLIPEADKTFIRLLADIVRK
jgi:protoporphyrin/coproporphyrin ferrochelatase